MTDGVPRLTIAIPTFNNDSSIENAVCSALSQRDLKDCEILVVDNASTDGTAAILGSLEKEPALRYVRNGRNLGLWENHNVCLREARGQYVLFCHADDSLQPDATAIVKGHLASRHLPDRYVCWGHSSTTKPSCFGTSRENA